MKLYLVSNNLLLNGLNYDNTANLDVIRLIRPLSVNGEKIALKLADFKEFENIEKIYSSNHSSAVSSAKYLSEKLELEINLDERLNDCKVGLLGSKNMKMVKGLQDHEFTYKLPNGESLYEVGNRLNNYISMLINKNEEVVVFTHKRAILGLLLKYAKVGYNLDDNLILHFNNKQIYDDTETELDIYELVIEDKKIIDINKK